MPKVSEKMPPFFRIGGCPAGIGERNRAFGATIPSSGSSLSRFSGDGRIKKRQDAETAEMTAEATKTKCRKKAPERRFYGFHCVLSGAGGSARAKVRMVASANS